MYIILFEIFFFFFLNSASFFGCCFVGFFIVPTAFMVESEACQILILDTSNTILITDKSVIAHIKKKLIALSLRQISEIT